MTELVEHLRVDVEPGVRLNVTRSGSGPVLLLLHGWRQSAALFKYQLNYFSQKCQVVAPDFRGHGRSDVPLHGYTIEQCAADLERILAELRIDTCDLVAHSMGCVVAWCMLKNFGHHRFRRMVFVDQASRILASEELGDSERQSPGAVLTPSALNDVCRAIAAPFASYGYIDRMLTDHVSAPEREWIVAENRRLPAFAAAELYRDMALKDWSSVIAAICQPVLVVCGACGAYPEASQRWIAKTTARGRFVRFAAEAGGAHMPFLENPRVFNAEIDYFLTGDEALHDHRNTAPAVAHSPTGGSRQLGHDAWRS